ncbi:MAG: hypothetical protein KIT72_03095 [Polyangiaceae bacterium]|nr:hypothetical protein [Polyangiaceae bacterium]MCW5789387.1 hypothetical protein [Polyangiaceae bacterium]
MTVADPAQVQIQVQQAVNQAATQVLGAKLAQHQIAVQTLAHSAPALAPEILQAMQASLPHAQLSQLQLQLSPELPAAPPIHAPVAPFDPMAAVKDAYVQEAKDRLDPSNYEVRAKLNIGGFKVGLSSEDGLDTDGLKKQAKDKVVSKLIGCVIGAVILLLIVAVAVGVGWYVWSQSKNTTPGTAAAPATAVAASELETSDWDGSKPLMCMNKKLLVKGVTAKVTGTAVSGMAGCVLVLEDCNIDASMTAVQTTGNAHITIKGGTIKGKMAALNANGGTIVVEGGAKIDGKVKKVGTGTIEGAE